MHVALDFAALQNKETLSCFVYLAVVQRSP